MNKKVEELENRIKELENHDINHLENYNYIIEDLINNIIKRVKKLENHNINNIIKRVERLDNKIDDLEAKNYQLKSDLDKIIKYLDIEPQLDKQPKYYSADEFYNYLCDEMLKLNNKEGK